MAAKSADTVVCSCSKFEIAKADGTKVNTGCTSVTKKVFAPGHDAKLKSLLVQAGLDGGSVHVTEEDGTVSIMTHSAAAKIHDMVDHVEKGIRLAKERLERKKKAEEAAAAKAAE